MKFLICFLLLTLLLSPSGDDKEVIWIDNFESTEINDWHGRANDYHNIYKLDSLEGSSYLSASSMGSDNFLIKKVDIDLVKYPYLNWKWRAKTLPINGNESKKKNCDIAASLNVVLRASKWRPQTIKYSWSTTLPKHTITKSPFAHWPSRTDIVVMQTGEENLGNWTTEKVNVLDHYKMLYKKKKVKSRKVEAFVIMTDSDNTNSLSEADYDEIYFSKQ